MRDRRSIGILCDVIWCTSTNAYLYTPILYTYATYTLHSGMHCTIHAELNSKPGKRCGGNTYDMFEEDDRVSKLMDSGLQH